MLTLESFGFIHHRLDKTKLYVVGAGIFSGVTVALYPVSVIKTRMQVASKDAAQKNAFAAFKNILRADGIPGLYRGFATVITGAIPARIIFLTSLETTKAALLQLVRPLNLSEPAQAAIANGLAGMSASICSQSVFVPIDVVWLLLSFFPWVSCCFLPSSCLCGMINPRIGSTTRTSYFSHS